MTSFASAALTSPSAARNREPILAVLRRVLPARGLVLEIASGTGEHAVHCAGALPDQTWQPSDRDPEGLASIAAHRAEAGLPNLLAPLALDVTAPSWPVERADAIVAINMIHIAPWRAAEGLIEGAGRLLAPGGVVYLYGPFIDESLKARDPAWGVRDVAAVAELAARHGLDLKTRAAMPANNLSLVFRKR